jgi:TRAP-type mannitol/chloroaromatic compound transport system permease small subunit
MGAAYTLEQEEHVRVDVFYRTMSNTRRAWIDLFGVCLFLGPLCAYLAWTSYDFVTVSWSLREASRESGGLPYPLIPLLKTVLLLMPVAVALQGISLLLRAVRTLRRS